MTPDFDVLTDQTRGWTLPTRLNRVDLGDRHFHPKSRVYFVGCFTLGRYSVPSIEVPEKMWVPGERGDFELSCEQSFKQIISTGHK